MIFYSLHITEFDTDQVFVHFLSCAKINLGINLKGKTSFHLIRTGLNKLTLPLVLFRVVLAAGLGLLSLPHLVGAALSKWTTSAWPNLAQIQRETHSQYSHYG